MSPIDWALRPLKKYATFSGRAPRAEFWWFFLAISVIYLVLSFVFGVTIGGMAAAQTDPSSGVLGMFGAAGMFLILFWLALLIPMIAVQVRRLHDTNRSGWWIGAFYLLYVAYLVLMVGTLGSVMGAAMGGADPQPNTGMFGVIMVVGLLFFIYSIALLVFYCLPGTKGPNKYGEDPYGGNLGEVFA